MGTISEKLTYLNTTKTNLKDMINYGLPSEEQITSSTTFRNYVSSIFEAFLETLRNPDTLFTNLPKTSGSGSQITLNGTANAPMRITLNPTAISQDGTPTPDSPQDIHTISGSNSIVVEGKNKYNKATSLNNTIFTTNTGATSSNSNYITSDYIQVEPNTTYYVYGLTVVGGYDKNNNFISMIRNSSSNGSFTTPANCYYIRIRNYNQLSTTTLQNETSDITYLVVGNKSTTYEPYQSNTQTNTIDLTPYNLGSIGNYENKFIRSDGKKNLFNIQTLVKGRLDNGVIGYESGTTALTKNDTSFTFTTNANYRGVASDYIEVDGGNSYFISIANDKTGIGMGGACYDINKTYISTPTAISMDNHTNRIDLPSNAKYFRIGIQLSTTGTITITNPQFEKGQATEYTPYEKGWYYKEGIEKYVFTGNETPYSITNGYYYYADNLGALKYVIGGFNTKFLFVNDSRITDNGTANTYLNENEMAFRLGSTKDRLYIKTQLSSTDLKSTLANTPLYYVKATTTYTKITGELAQELEQVYKGMLSYDGTTNISQVNNDLPFTLSVSAIEDLS